MKASIIDIENMKNNCVKITVNVIYADNDPVHINFDFINDSENHSNPGYDLSISAVIYANTDKALTVMKTCEAIEKMLAHYSYISEDFYGKFGTVKYLSDLESNYKLNSKYNVRCTYKNNLRNSDSFIYTITTRLI